MDFGLNLINKSTVLVSCEFVYVQVIGVDLILLLHHYDYIRIYLFSSQIFSLLHIPYSSILDESQCVACSR